MKLLRLAAMALLVSTLAMKPTVTAASGHGDSGYSGRAVFELMRDARIPPPFHGLWVPLGQKCVTPPTPGTLDINADGIMETDGAVSVLRIWLYPGDAPNFDHAIIDVLSSGGGDQWEESLILNLAQGGRALSMRQKGEDEANATTYRRC